MGPHKHHNANECLLVFVHKWTSTKGVDYEADGAYCKSVCVCVCFGVPQRYQILADMPK